MTRTAPVAGSPGGEPLLINLCVIGWSWSMLFPWERSVVRTRKVSGTKVVCSIRQAPYQEDLGTLVCDRQTGWHQEGVWITGCVTNGRSRTVSSDMWDKTVQHRNHQTRTRT